MSDLGFAFIDVETTGLNLKGTDRVVEVGVVLADSNMQIERTFETLLNPHRDVGPTSIHGITAADVLNAPDFADIAPVLLALFQGRVVVGHNVTFDVKMLDAEFAKVGVSVSWGNPICTLLASISVFGGKLPRKLSALTASLGIAHDEAHAALNDAEACLELAKVIEEKGFGVFARPTLEDTFEAELVGRPNLELAKTRSRNSLSSEVTFVQELVSKIPTGFAGGSGASYLEMLDRALADYRIDASEREVLFDTANQLGLRLEDVSALHDSYVRDLALAASSDGIVTQSERGQIHKIAEILGVSTLYCEQLLQLDSTSAGENLRVTKQTLRLETGQSVVLTGDMNPSKQHFEQLFRDRGLLIADGVSKKVSMVFAGDPASQSGKAKKARQYGLPVVSVYDWNLFID